MYWWLAHRIPAHLCLLFFKAFKETLEHLLSISTYVIIYNGFMDREWDTHRLPTHVCYADSEQSVYFVKCAKEAVPIESSCWRQTIKSFTLLIKKSRMCAWRVPKSLQNGPLIKLLHAWIDVGDMTYLSYFPSVFCNDAQRKQTCMLNASKWEEKRERTFLNDWFKITLLVSGCCLQVALLAFEKFFFSYTIATRFTLQLSVKMC